MKTTILSVLTRSLIFSVIFFLVGLLGLSLYVFYQNRLIGERVFPNVYINKVPFGGAEGHEIDKFIAAMNTELEDVSIVIKYDHEVATFSAKMLELKYESMVPKTQALYIGRSENTPTRLYQKIVTILNLGQFNFSYTPNYSTVDIKEHLDVLKQSYEKPPQDALFEIKNNRVVAFRKEENGIALEVEPALDKINKSLSKLELPIPKEGKQIVIEIDKTISKPKTTLAQINNFGIVEKIGEGTSDYTGSIPGRIHNVILATSKFNGVIIPKNSVFSFNDTVGDITAATGYLPAYIIKQGQTVLGDGGGVCQVSTTLFRATLDAGLPIVERTAHAYRVHYYENDRKPGFDATVFGPTVDFKFKNDTEAAILLQTSVDKTNRIVTFSLYGKKDGRTRTISEVTIWGVTTPPEARFQDDPTLSFGTQKQVDWAAPGTKAKFHYRVEKNGEIIQDKDFLSVYRPWQAVFLVGTGG